MSSFVWTRMQGQAGQTIEATIERKEAERRAGNGYFWWGIGNNLPNLADEARRNGGGNLTVLFSLMLSAAAKHDTDPDGVLLWTGWRDQMGVLHDIPHHVVCLSRATSNPRRYALICQSSEAIAIGDQCFFNPASCTTLKGLMPGSQQVTALLRGDLDGDHQAGRYCKGFRAALIEPWVVPLAEPRRLTPSEREAFDRPSAIQDWTKFTADLRACRLQEVKTDPCLLNADVRIEAPGSPFKLKFDPAKISRWAGRYDVTEDEAALAAGARIAAGSYTRENLEIIFKWKTGNRGVSRLARNSSAEIADALKLAVLAETDRSAVAVLRGLSGVDTPVASAILTAINPERYTVIDFRALEALGTHTLDRSVPFYLTYLSYCRETAATHKVTLRTFDRALWQWSADQVT